MASLAITGQLGLGPLALDTVHFVITSIEELIPGGCYLPSPSEVLTLILTWAPKFQIAVDRYQHKDPTGAAEEIQSATSAFLVAVIDDAKSKGVDCAATELAKLLKKPVELLLIGKNYALWIGKIFWDYNLYQGRDATATVHYDVPGTIEVACPGFCVASSGPFGNDPTQSMTIVGQSVPAYAANNGGQGGSPLPCPAASGWSYGSLVGLRRGAEIWQGEGSQGARVVVPDSAEQPWNVVVKDGPRCVDGEDWYDIDRKAAGDASGGSGWVNRTQAQFAAPQNPQPGGHDSGTLPAGADTNCNSAGLLLYQNSGFSGSCVHFAPGTSIPDLSTWPNIVSSHSVKRIGGDRYQVCGQANFTQCITIPDDLGPSDQGNLDIQPTAGPRIGGTVRSLRPAAGSGSTPDGTSTDCHGGEGLILWQNSGFGGNCIRILRGASLSDISASWFSNAHSFTRIGGGKSRICGQPNFGGTCVTVPDDFGPSDSGNLDNQPSGRTLGGNIKSVSVEASTPPPPVCAGVAVLYRNQNRGGDCKGLSVGNYDTLSDFTRTWSLALSAGYHAKLCTDISMNGTCYTFETGVDAFSDQLNDNVRSAYVRPTGVAFANPTDLSAPTFTPTATQVPGPIGPSPTNTFTPTATATPTIASCSGSPGQYSTSTTDAPVDGSASGTFGSNTVFASNAAFTAGQKILIHQSRGSATGTWEVSEIASYNSGTITTVQPLVNSYSSSGGNRAQVIVVKQFSSLTIDPSVTVSAKPWDGTTGGIYAVIVCGSATINGTLTATGAGFRGGNAPGSTNTVGTTGEGSQGDRHGSTSNTNAEGTAGLGDKDFSGASGAGGGGGGNGGPGGRGYAGGGQPGPLGGQAAGVLGAFGGGGASGSNGNTSGAGSAGNGGGFIFLLAGSLTISGTGFISADGLSGGNAPSASSAAAGGGGAGGSIRLFATSVILGLNRVTANGGAGGSTGHGGQSGAGGTPPGGDGMFDGGGGAGGSGRIQTN